MKKTKLLTILLSVLILLCGIFLLASCGGANEENDKGIVTEPISTPTETEHAPIKLTAPTVVLIDDTATWSADASADKFEISVDGTLSCIEKSMTSKKLSDNQTFKIRAIGDGINYKTSDWSNTVTYVKSVSSYTVTWKNGDIILETDFNVAEGTLPTYDGAVPTKAADTQFVYIFSGWSPAISQVSGNVTYTAEFTSVPNSYTIIWKNGDTVLETDENLTYGTIPSYDSATPTKDSTAQYTYTFSGWSPQINQVTESVTYQAQFTTTLRTYTVTFFADDGITVLDTVTVDYGSNAAYTRGTPVKNATAGYTYVFEKWVTAQGGTVADDLTNIVANRSVFASFKQFVRTVSVYIIPNNADYGTVSVSVLNNIPYGAAITVSGGNITINGQVISAIENNNTAQYTYTFIGWTANATVGNDTTVIANFSRTVNTYTVTWKNEDTVLEIDEAVPYGTTPVYNAEQPTKSSDGQTVYIFSGWSPALSIVTDNITYVAQFTNTANTHTVIFYDEDGVTELGRAIVAHGGTAVYPNSLPIKESTLQHTYSFDQWVTERNGSTKADFTNITADQSVFATYSVAVRTYTVTFCDYDGTVLSHMEVAYGNSATAPGDPEREGFRFDGWDHSYSNIIGDLTVKAKYVQQFTVEFLDYDHSVIDIQLVDYQGNATAPQSPTRTNYRFIGWNTVFTNIVSNLTVQAEYVRQYKVTFLDYDGTILKETTVDEGDDASAPVDPTLEGYVFNGWDKNLTDISTDLIIKATYKLKTYTVTFVMPDGTVLYEAQKVEHGFSAIAPDHPEFFLVGTGDYTEVYGFTRWDQSFDNVTKDLVIEAVYESVYTKPVIIVEFSQERNGDAKLYLYNHESMMLNALELSINYNTRTGNISINSADINPASPLWVENSDGSNNNQYVINNNENSFTFAWSDANGKQFDWCSKVITFSFSTDGAVVSKDTFMIDGCSAIISDIHGENLEKITPAVVYR